MHCKKAVIREKTTNLREQGLENYSRVQFSPPPSDFVYMVVKLYSIKLITPPCAFVLQGRSSACLPLLGWEGRGAGLSSGRVGVKGCLRTDKFSHSLNTALGGFLAESVLNARKICSGNYLT